MGCFVIIIYLMKFLKRTEHLICFLMVVLFLRIRQFNTLMSVFKILTGLDKQNFQLKIVNIFLPINFNICFGCSKERSHRDGSFEYPQHMFWLRNKKIKFSLRALN